MRQPKSSTEPLETNLAVQLLTAGTAACIADFITFPLDTAKVRLQVSSILFCCILLFGLSFKKNII